MDNSEYERRRNLTFEQAEGVSPLPNQLRLGEVSPETRAMLWAAVHSLLLSGKSKYDPSLQGTVVNLARRHFVEVQHRMIDEFQNNFFKVSDNWKRHFAPEASYTDALGFVQWLLRQWPRDDFGLAVASILEKTRTAYRVVNKTIMPLASEAEAAAVTLALANAQDAGMGGARKHILDAGASLTRGDYADSIRESMSAVESVCLSATGETSFAKAVGVLNERRPMNGAFKIALNRLYDFTSQEPGLRHAERREPSTNIEERDAVFMLGVCAAFVTYVLAE